MIIEKINTKLPKKESSIEKFYCNCEKRKKHPPPSFSRTQLKPANPWANTFPRSRDSRRAKRRNANR